ncbi:MAG: M28 family peptidase [Rhodothermales bacterium]|nr:M28 family peptidase [Rhodothermales bacterium]MBO6780627.1 M28 family peptidase [Rhodothermales bacterium]
MKRMILVFSLLLPVAAAAQSSQVVDAIHRDGMERSEVMAMAQYLADVIGPRLTASPAHEQAIDWAMGSLESWGIASRREAQGTWRSWKRGFVSLDLIEPRTRSLEGQLLTWSPGTEGSAEGPVVLLPDLRGAEQFSNWLPSVRGKFVMLTPYEPTCRPMEVWQDYGGTATRSAFETWRKAERQAWESRVKNLGLSRQEIIDALENAGVAGFLTNLWTGERGTDRIFPLTYSFQAMNRRAAAFNLSCEDYGLLYRLAKNNQGPVLRAYGEAESLGEAPAHNLIARIPGRELPDEYVVLSAHFDAWDGASGMTDNGTGSVVMLEAMRLLAMHYPQPRRTILLGLWSGEEQGLNGSRGFVADHPEVVDGLQALFNQDNGTGRIETIDMQGLSAARPFFDRWFNRIPAHLVDGIELVAPGTPGQGGSDYVSFICAGAPAFNLASHEFDYRFGTWHTNRDTFDKVSPADLRANATLVALLAYLAAEDERLPRIRAAEHAWPECRLPDRSTGDRFR